MTDDEQLLPRDGSGRVYCTEGDGITACADTARTWVYGWQGNPETRQPRCDQHAAALREVVALLSPEVASHVRFAPIR